MHAAGPDLPLALDQATLVLLAGLGVLLVVAYDLYRHRWLPGVPD